MRAALVQMTSSDDPAHNVRIVSEMLRHAKSQGASFVLTPEVTNCVSTSRAQQEKVLQSEANDITLDSLREDAARLGIWVLAGSLALKGESADGRFVNRSFMITSDGDIVARYDKIHMFDVDVSADETYRESDGYAPGNRCVVAQTPFGKVGMAICYDLRFPYLFRTMAQAGAQIITVPAAFSYLTGPAHWQPLLQARAIENGAYLLAPAQTGTHPAQQGKHRTTHGHSLAISPWGEILSDAGTQTGVSFIDLNIEDVQNARKKIPSLQHDRTFIGPDE